MRAAQGGMARGLVTGAAGRLREARLCPAFRAGGFCGYCIGGARGLVTGAAGRFVFGDN